jgi:DNA-binding PadR family transcriptional regulator
MLVLSMLSSTPKNGIEVINEIEATTHGWWRPSPGSVYPVLEQLASEGLIHKREDGRYETTSKAHEELDWPFGPAARKSQSVEEMLTEMASYVTYFEELSTADPKKVAPHIDKLRTLGERISKLKVS